MSGVSLRVIRTLHYVDNVYGMLDNFAACFNTHTAQHTHTHTHIIHAIIVVNATHTHEHLSIHAHICTHKVDFINTSNDT